MGFVEQDGVRQTTTAAGSKARTACVRWGNAALHHDTNREPHPNVCRRYSVTSCETSVRSTRFGIYPPAERPRAHPDRLMPLRVVLIGDHPADLRQQLVALPASLDLHIAGSYPDRSAARAALSSPTPDVAIIAATLTDGSGFEFVESLPEGSRPHAIVFLSAREADAVRAFELQATDLVSIPIAASRLHEAMTRARHQALQVALLRTAEELQRLIGATASSRASVGQLGSSALGPKSGNHDATLSPGRNVDPWTMAAMEGGDVWQPAGGGDVRSPTHALATIGPERTRGSFSMNAARWRKPVDVPVQPASAMRNRTVGAGEGVLDLTHTWQQSGTALYDDGPVRVLVREGRRTRFIPLADVDWFEADGNYIVVHVADQRYRTRGTITAIEAGLDPRQFVRIHRRMVVNMDRVREMSPLPGGDGLLILGGGTTLRLSRTYRTRVR